ncbi:hypothetical protein V8C86DRAFT_2741901, partial [Haematococcus lacustris]
MGSGTEAAIGRVGGRVNLKSREGERKEGRGGKGGTLLYSVAAMLAITGPCYTVMFQLSPTLLLVAQAPGYTSWLCLLAALPAFLWLHCCIAASLHRCTSCHFLSLPL